MNNCMVDCLQSVGHVTTSPPFLPHLKGAFNICLHDI